MGMFGGRKVGQVVGIAGGRFRVLAVVEVAGLGGGGGAPTRRGRWRAR